MESVTCPSCNHQTSPELNFCENCEKQVICLNPECRKTLRAGKTICLFCGHSLLTTNKENQSNTFTRYRKQEGQDFVEEIKINMTDHAVDKLAPFVTGQIIPQDSQYQKGLSEINNANSKQLPPVSEEDDSGFNHDEYYAENQESSTASEVLENTANTKNTAYKYFEKDGEKLVVTEKDFKGDNRKEQQRRFLLLYTSAYFHYFQKPVPPKDEYRKAAQAINLYNHKNFTTYLNLVTSKFMTSLTEGFKLNSSGEKEVEKILKEMENEKVKSGFPYWERSITAPAKPLRFTKDDEAKIKEWAKDEVDLGKLQIGDLKKGLEYALVGIWILTIHLNKEKAVRWIDAYHYLKEKFTTIKATKKAVSLSLLKSTSEKYVVKTDDKLYLNSAGKNLVEKWVAGTAAKM